MEGCTAVGVAGRRSATSARDHGCAVRHGARPSHLLETRPRHALCELHSAVAAGTFPRRSGDRGTAGLADALERIGHGGASEPGLRRTGRSHRQLRQRSRSVRGGLQPFLPRRTRRIQRRRPGLLPGAFSTWRLRARLSRRATERAGLGLLPPGDCGSSRGQAGTQQLPAPLADAGLLAVPNGLDGAGADQLHLPGALHALPQPPATAEHGRPQSVGRVWRRRDGRAGKHVGPDARLAREARQPDLGGELQSAASGRSGARQQPRHRRTRGAVRGCGLARHQAGVGFGLGRFVCQRHQRGVSPGFCADRRRPVPDLCGQGWSLQPRAFLRPEPPPRRLGGGSER